MTAFVPSFYYGGMAPADEHDDTTTAIETTVELPSLPSASIYSTYLTTGMAPPAYQQQQKKPAAEPVDQLPSDYFLRSREESLVETAIASSTHKEYKESTYVATFAPLKVQEVKSGSRLVHQITTANPVPKSISSQLERQYAAAPGDAFKPVHISEYHFDKLNDLVSYVDAKY